MTGRDPAAEVAFLTRALKAPTLREAVGRLAERARAESWTHEEFLIACLQREVSARESHGGEGRLPPARVPPRKALEDFDYDHAPGLQRDNLRHPRAPHLVPGRDNRPSLIVTSNNPFGRGGEVSGDDVVAAAMIDRLVHHADVIALKGDSYRLRNRDLGRTPTTSPEQD